MKTLDLSHCHSKRTLKGLTLYFTWIRLEDAYKQCLVILREGDELSEHAKPCIVTVDKAWVFSEEVGDGRQAARICASFANSLRVVPEMRELVKIHSLINDHLGDLCSIPPYQPPEPLTAIAELTVKNSETGEIREVELREDV